MGTEALEPVLAAFARGELTGVADRFSEDATYREARKAPIRGRSAIAAEFTRYAASRTVWRFEVDEVIAGTDRACVVYRFALPGGEGEPWRERAGCATVRFDARGQIAEWREYEG